MSMRQFHIGRKAPKGWVEIPGALHMGRGIWLMEIVKPHEVPDWLRRLDIVKARSKAAKRELQGKFK